VLDADDRRAIAELLLNHARLCDHLGYPVAANDARRKAYDLLAPLADAPGGVWWVCGGAAEGAWCG
jgi:hypothetical protein